MLSQIKSLCALHGINVKGVEKILGFSNGSIYRWDENSPSIEKVTKVADYFGVSIDYLVGRNYNAPTVNPSYMGIIEKMDELNADGINALNNYLDFLLSRPENLKKNNLDRKVEA